MMANTHWEVDWEAWNAAFHSGELVSFCVRGTAYENDDGVKRYNIVENMINTERVELRIECNNKYDKNAIGVYCASGMIGYVPMENVADVEGIMSGQYMAKAKVKIGESQKKFVIVEIITTPKNCACKAHNYVLESNVVGISKNEKENIVPYLNVGEEVLVFFVFNQKDCRCSDDVYVTPKSYFSYSDETILGRLDKKSAAAFKQYLDTNIRSESNWFNMKEFGCDIVGSVKSVSASGKLVVKVEISKS